MAGDIPGTMERKNRIPPGLDLFSDNALKTPGSRGISGQKLPLYGCHPILFISGASLNLCTLFCQLG